MKPQKRRKPIRTDNQRQIMSVILQAASEGKFLTQKELYDRMCGSFDMPSYGAFRTSLRFLENQLMIERKRKGPSGGVIGEIVPTDRGYGWFRPRT